MNRTGIEYLNFTSNPIVGCDMTLPCAERCWARRMAHRLKSAGVRQYQDVVNREGNWTGKTAFNEAELAELFRRREPAIIGLCYMGDCFHESVPDDWLDRMFAACTLTPQLRYLILTKRAKRMRQYMQGTNGAEPWSDRVMSIRRATVDYQAFVSYPKDPITFPLPNVALGVSCEDGASLHRLDDLHQTPAACRVLSAAPLLENLGELNLDGIGWVIVEGETRSGARPMHPYWAMHIRDQCQAAGVPYFHKQNGEWAFSDSKPGTMVWSGGYGINMIRVGKHAAGRRLDGKVWDQLPEGWNG
jgi:protein gp37